MYAIVDIAGQQFKVEKDKKIYVHRLTGEEGDEISFNKVLLIDNDENVLVGEPVLNGAMVHAKILGHLKGEKVLVFKKKRRKDFKKLKGHRQYFSQILIEEIVSEGGVMKAPAKKARLKAEDTEVVAEAKAEKKPATKKAVEKKPAEKKAKAATGETKKAPAKKAAPAKATKEKEAKPAKESASKAKAKPTKK